MQGQDLYCKLCVSGAAAVNELTGAVGDVTHGQVMVAAGLVSTSALEISVHAESRHLPLDDESEDFVRWRHYLEVDAAGAHTQFDAFLVELTQLIVGLRLRGLRVVAACDFEDLLEARISRLGHM